MATYSNPDRITYSYGVLVFTAALAHAINPPPTCRNGRVTDIHVRATVLFTAVTTAAIVNVGTIATPAKYAILNCGALAANAAQNFTSAGGSPLNLTGIVISDINFDRDGVTAIQVQVVPPTGGAPAGTGYLDVTIGWF